MKVAFYTLGCKVNQYETEAMKELFLKNGDTIVDFEDFANIYVINTCTVTNLAASKGRKMIRRAKRKNENSIVAVVGCYVQESSEEISKIEGVDILLGTDDRGLIIEMIDEHLMTNKLIKKVKNLDEVREFEELKISNLKNMTRAYMKIQEGCNQFCSYCIIPYVRGRIRSRKLENIRKEAIRLSNNGFKEIVLTGIHVASYGKDLEGDISLIDALKILEKIEGIKRVRLSSVEPRIIDKEFIKEIKNFKKLCNHFHLSLQSGSEDVLKRMNRKYNKKEYKNAVELLRKNFKDVSITTDIIVGFPGETKKEFEETMDFINEIGFSKIHVFKYSKRKGTKAYEMKKQVNSKIKKKRSKKLRKLAQKLERKYLDSFISNNMKVLFEEYEDGYNIGHTKNYLKVKYKNEKNFQNKVIDVKIVDRENDILIAE